MKKLVKLVELYVKRSDVGYEKYNNTLDDERRLKMKNLQGYLNDVQEELMDAILYIQAARDELQDLSEEALIDKFRDNDIDVDYPKYENDYDDEEED